MTAVRLRTARAPGEGTAHALDAFGEEDGHVPAHRRGHEGSDTRRRTELGAEDDPEGDVEQGERREATQQLDRRLHPFVGGEGSQLLHDLIGHGVGDGPERGEGTSTRRLWTGTPGPRPPA